MSNSFTEEQRRRLAGRARTLRERVQGPKNEPGPDPLVDPERVLTAWQNQYENVDAFEARLEYEGLYRETVHEMIENTLWPKGIPLPEWISVIEDLVTFLGDRAQIESSDVPLPDDIPFRELLGQIVSFSLEQLRTPLPNEALQSLMEFLAKRLERLSVRVLYVEFKSFVLENDESLIDADPEEFSEIPDKQYQSFVSELFDGEFEHICLEYPVFARQISITIEFWVEMVEEIGTRVATDRAELRRQFGLEGEVTSISPLTTDCHGRGRVPVRVSFEEKDVILKPRPVGGGQAFYALIDRIEDELPYSPVPKPQYLNRDSYGWMEPADYRDLPDEEAAERYYRRAGVILALAYSVNFTDCHLENVVAHGDTPVVVDGETVFHPRMELDRVLGQPITQELIVDTPYLTYLLPFSIGSPKRSGIPELENAYRAGFGSKTEERSIASVSLPSLTNVNTDLMEVSGEHPTRDRSENTPSIGAEDHPPVEYVDALVDAFARAETAVHEVNERAGELGGIVDPELVDGIENRMIVKETATYSSLLRSATARKPLCNGIRLSVEFEELASPLFSGRADTDRWWPIYDAERTALLRRDIPRLTTSPSEQRVYHDGEPLGTEVDIAGAEAVRRRLSATAGDEQSQRVERVRQAFEKVDTAPKPSASATASEDRLRSEALELFGIVRTAGIQTEAGTGWVSASATGPMQFMPADESLHYGVLGIALTAGALYTDTGNHAYYELVEELTDRVATRTFDEGAVDTLGSTAGLGSIIYTFSVLTELLDDDRFRQEALRATKYVTEERIENSRSFDITHGVSGAALGLLAYYDRFGGEDVLSRATACGEYLLEDREAYNGQNLWLTEGEDDPAEGFAHGQSGVAYTLARLADATGSDEYVQPARQALKYDVERTLWNEPTSLHRDSGDDLPDWCNGRTGVTLALLSVGEYLGDRTLLSSAERQFVALSEAEMHTYDNLCCGNLGRADALLEGSRRTDVEFPSRRLVEQCIARREQYGAMNLPGHSQALPNVSFFDGLSGAAYTFLRHYDPDTYPCVLVFE